MPDAQPDPATRRRAGWRWLPLWSLLALVPLAALGLVLIPLAVQAKQIGSTRTFQLPSSATYPPPGISGVSGLPGGWMQQNLRVGNRVIQWHWRPDH